MPTLISLLPSLFKTFPNHEHRYIHNYTKFENSFNPLVILTAFQLTVHDYSTVIQILGQYIVVAKVLRINLNKGP